MNKRFKLLLVASSLIPALSACSMIGGDSGMFRDSDKDYLASEPTNGMSLPEGVAEPTFEPLYPVPEVDATDEFGDPYDLSEFKVPRPNPVSADENTFGVKLQKLGGDRWIFLSASTSQVWPHIQSYLTQNDVAVAESNARTGRIATDWLQYSDDESVMARFLIRVEKGLHPASTEVHMTEFQQPMGSENVTAPETWPTKSSDDTREEWMMRLMAKHLAESISNTSASLLGQNVGGEVKAGFVENASEPTLRLNINSGRSWATIAHSAKQEGFVTWDKDESAGLIYTGYYKNQHKKRGFWRTLFTLGISNKLPEEVDHDVAVLIKHLSGAEDVRARFKDVPGAAFDDALKGVKPGYLIMIVDSGNYSDVVIRDHRGRRVDSSKSKQLLRLLRKNLI